MRSGARGWVAVAGARGDVRGRASEQGHLSTCMCSSGLRPRILNESNETKPMMKKTKRRASAYECACETSGSVHSTSGDGGSGGGGGGPSGNGMRGGGAR